MKELDIGEVARLSGVVPSTLRFYEKKGLIRPLGRNGLRRQYHENVLNTLQLIALGQTECEEFKKVVARGRRLIE